MNKVVLIADSDAQTREFISLAAKSAGYTPVTADKDVLPDTESPYAAVLSSDNAELAKRLRKKYKDCAIYFLGAEKGENTVCVPIDPAQLSKIFGAAAMPNGVLLDEKAGVLTVGDKKLTLTLNEQELFRHFAANPNRAFSNEELALEVFGADIQDVRTLARDTASSLARKLEGISENWALKHLWGVGYKFEIMTS